MFTRAISLLLLSCLAGGAQTGTAVPGLAIYDLFMNSIMAKYNIPGGAIALTQNGHLIFARGYGYADQEKQTPVQPDSLFRIASLSKAITAVTIMHLVEQGKLNLSQPAFAQLPDLQAPAGATVDSRIPSITVQDLLEHSGGWDDSSSGSNFDPMYNSPTIIRKLSCSAPASTENTIRYMLGQPLQFDPGKGFAYSNFGYAVLGRIIEHVTGMSYEEYVRTQVLAPMGISQMRIGNTLPQGQLPGEVKYYGPGTEPSVFPDVSANPVSNQYGGWYLEGQDANGGWVASAIDYAKFLNAMEGRRGNAFLMPASIAAMTAQPAIPYWADSSYWYGFGLNVEPAGGGVNWWHNGSDDGTTTYEIRTHDGFDWVVFFNTRPSSDQNTDQITIDADIQGGLWNAYYQVASWPSNDQFVNYPDSQAGATEPAITTRDGVVNGATFDRGVVSGSWITIFGVNFASTTQTWSGADFVNGNLPTSLNGVSVNVDGVPAFIEYVSPTQINVQAPAGLTPAWVTVEVIANGVSTGVVLTHAELNAPGAFTYSAGGLTLALATEPDGTIIGDPTLEAGAQNAAPGSPITIWASGLAPSLAGTLNGFPQPISGVQVTIGKQPAAVSFAGAVSPGLFQINVTVPATLTAGEQPVVLMIGGASSPSGGVIPIS
jgi:N-acyl-D-amino-acid deacylase